MSEEKLEIPPQTPKRMFKKIECPFDLDAVFTMQYSTEGLKSVLEFILENLGTLDMSVGEHKG